MNNNKEKELLYLQILGSITFIITISISIILTVNDINKLNNKKPLFNTAKENNISLSNRFTIAVIATVFTYISYQFYKMNKYSQNIDISQKELVSSILNLISTVILLYATIEGINRKSNNTDSTIPII